MAIIKVEVKTEELEIKTRRSTLAVDINVVDGEVTVHYLEERYYLDAESEEVLLSSEPDRYQASYDSWEASSVGEAIDAAIKAELSKDVPGV